MFLDCLSGRLKTLLPQAGGDSRRETGNRSVRRHAQHPLALTGGFMTDSIMPLNPARLIKDGMCSHRPGCPDALTPDRTAARPVACHPEQGWSLLCNGVVLFDDGGLLLPDGRAVSPTSRCAAAAALGKTAAVNDRGR